MEQHWRVAEVREPTALELALAAHETSFDHLLKLVEDGGLDDHDDLGLLEVAQRLERLRNRTALIDHRIVRDAEVRRLPERFTQPDVARVLAMALRLSPAEAARRVRAAGQVAERISDTGQPLPVMRPALSAAQRSGDASAEHVDICLRAIEKVDHRGFDPADLDSADALLGTFCSTYGPPELRDLAARVVDRIDPDGTRPDDEIAADRRHLVLRRLRDGMWVVDGRLTGALGAKLTAVLGPLAGPQVTTTTSPTGHILTEPDPRHHGQRMHDALGDLCDRLLVSGTLPHVGGTPATVVVTIPLDDLVERTGSGVTSDGTRLRADPIIRDLAGEALIHPVVVDARGAVLWMGRTSRLATAAQTAALYARDGGCSFPGCHRPPEWCERHHIRAWVDGGPTDVDNLTLLCSFHHHQFLGGGWSCRMVDGLPHWLPPRWMDPERRPQLNARIALRRLRC